MAYPKGKPRPEGAGRKKGTPNRNTRDLIAKCDEMGLDVFGAMIEIAMNGDDEQRFHMLKEIAQYIYPKRKAVELSNSEDKGFRVVVENYTDKK